MKRETQIKTRRWAIPAAILGVIIIGLLLLPSLIDINSYRNQIRGQLQDRLGRSVSLGTLGLTVFPSIDIDVADAVIGDDPEFSQDAFISAKAVSLKIGLWSLLTGNPQIRRIELTEPMVALIKAKSGAWNWSTLKLMEPQGPAPEAALEPETEPAPIDIIVDNGRFSLLDRSQSPPTENTTAGVNLRLEGFSRQSALDFELALTVEGQESGDLKANGAIGPIDSQNLAATPIEAKLRMNHVSLRGLQALVGRPSHQDGRITLDVDVSGQLAEALIIKGGIQVDGLRLVEEAEPADIPLEAQFELNAKMQEKAGVMVTIDAGVVKLGDTALRISGQLLHIPSHPRLDLHLKGAALSLAGLLEVARALGSGPPKGTTASGRANLDLRLQAGPETPPGQGANVSISGRGNLSDARIKAPQLSQPFSITAADLIFTGDKLRIRSLRAEVAQSQISGWAQIDNFQAPVASFDLNLDQLIVSEFQKLLAAAGNSRHSGPSAVDPSFSLPPPVMARERHRLSERGSLRASGHIGIGRVLYDDLVATNLQSKVDVHDDVIELNPTEFDFYDGRYKGRLSVDMSGREPRTLLAGRFDDVDMNQFMSAASSLKQVIYGRARGSLNLRSRGREFDPIVKSLEGLVQLRLSEGKITTFDLVRQILRIGKLRGMPIGDSETGFRELSAQLRFAHGRLRTENLKLALDEIEVIGAGGLQLGDPVTTDYELLAKLSEPLTRRVIPSGTILSLLNTFFMDGDSLVVPLKMSGPLRQPRFGLNGDVLRRALTDRFGNRPDEAIKGLLDIIGNKEKSKPKQKGQKP